MDRRWWAAALLVGSTLVASACTGLLAHDAEPEQLFFAMKIEDPAGRVLARPHLLGETGRRLSMRMVDPDRPELTRLELQMLPERVGEGYRVKVGLQLPELQAPTTGVLALAHGEERKLLLDGGGKPLAVTLLLMRVDSPEFDAWIDLVRREQLQQSS